MTAWLDFIESKKFEFIEGLERLGFEANDSGLVGLVGHSAGAIRVQVVLPEGFPFDPPIAIPPEDFPRSWHRERNGAMCLYPADSDDGMPWLDAKLFLDLVEVWVSESIKGWVNDFPDLDLERYFEPSGEPMVLYPDLTPLTGQVVRLRRAGDVTRLAGRATIPRKASMGKDQIFGFVTSIGEPHAPPADWEALQSLFPAEHSGPIARALGSSRLKYLLISYTRGGREAAVVLHVREDAAGEIHVTSVASASESMATLTLRAGASAPKLSAARVAVIGVGAIGSFVCDLLARSGVGEVAAFDHDVVRPGNLVRHLAPGESVGSAKAVAVKAFLSTRPYNSTKFEAFTTPFPSDWDVMGLFETFDLVIDATASGRVTTLLALAAGAGGHKFLSVCLQADGQVVRVDVIPPLSGEALPPTGLGGRPAREALQFEAGCGDPVSMTPPFAVLEAAATAVRHAVGLLTGTPVSKGGTVVDYR